MGLAWISQTCNRLRALFATARASLAYTQWDGVESPPSWWIRHTARGRSGVGRYRCKPRSTLEIRAVQKRTSPPCSIELHEEIAPCHASLLEPNQHRHSFPSPNRRRQQLELLRHPARQADAGWVQCQLVKLLRCRGWVAQRALDLSHPYSNYGLWLSSSNYIYIVPPSNTQSAVEQLAVDFMAQYQLSWRNVLYVLRLNKTVPISSM